MSHTKELEKVEIVTLLFHRCSLKELRIIKKMQEEQRFNIKDEKRIKVATPTATIQIK